jgi:hypothetical protein
LGWAVFADWPNALALFGITITVAAGLFIVLTERASAARPAHSEPAQPGPAAQPAE